MKKLIDFLKSLFCKKQDHTEDTKPTVDPEVVDDNNAEVIENDTDEKESVIVEDEKDTCDDCSECEECCDCECEECECECSDCECEECECCDCECATVVVSKDELVASELELWGIGKDTLGYNIIMAMIDIENVLTYDEISAELAARLDKSKASISSSLKSLVNKANFEASLFTAIKEINKEDNFKVIVEKIYLWVSKVL